MAPGGRFQTCIMVDAPGTRFVIDFGASSLVALNKMGIEHNSIDTVVLTHLHGDHCGGIPFMLMDAMLGAKRQTPLTIAGPRETEKMLGAVNEALMPGMNVMTPKFDLNYVEVDVMTPTQVGGPDNHGLSSQSHRRNQPHVGTRGGGGQGDFLYGRQRLDQTHEQGG